MDDAQSLLAEAKAAMERGDDAHAQRLLDELVSVQPKSEQAWLLLAKVVEHENERADCLEQALAINPDN
jgi:hypothetical protein